MMKGLVLGFLENSVRTVTGNAVGMHHWIGRRNLSGRVMQRTVFNKTRIYWAVEIWGKQVTDKNIKRTCCKWWWMAWLCLSVVLSPRSRDRLLIQMLIGHFAQKFSVHCRHRAFVVILQNFQTILLQVHSIKAPWVTLSKTHYSIPREAMKVC